jgi:ribonuclease-3
VNKSHETLARRIGYTFQDPALAARALTHRSHSTDHYERLEFLGDSVLNLVISTALYDRYPGLAEGELTRLRASLVNKPSLAALARTLDVGSCLLLGEGELKSGGFDRDSILADALEALFGAVYRDGGIEAARRVILALYDPILARLDPRAVPKDPKTRLQEHLQKNSLPTPVYQVVKVSGEAHHQHFVVECHVSGLDAPLRGEGNSRRAAEQEAAAAVLERLTGTDQP